MNDTDFSTTIVVDQSPEAAFAAITNVRGWWSEEIEGSTDRLGASFDYHFRDIHRCKIQVTELVPGERVVWRVLENHFSFVSDHAEWTGNELVFAIRRRGEATEIGFTQRGLVPAYECYEVCSSEWTNYLHGSLKALIETGKGSPNVRESAEAMLA